ncbi:MAG: glycine--tRNA ligase subunit beta, partial [Alphaproteobacteria bacterium]|nr:glycine--tRNA ligase subunit beta [Alphaproteobacteria bacterium]
KNAIVIFDQLFQKSLQDHGILFQDSQSYITPQRMVFKASIAPFSATVSEERRGPKVSAPDQAIQGFLKSVDLTSKDQLTVKDDYYFATLTQPAKDAKALLPSILEDVFHKMSWPKVMRYPGASLPWVRPVRHVICSFDGQALVFDLPYLGLTTAQTTMGHRFLSKEKINISTFAAYEADLKANSVILCHQERQKFIIDTLNDCASQYNLRLNVDQALLDEVTGLAEMPMIYMRPIPDKFMGLDESILVTSMTLHQKYFTFYDQDHKIAPYFALATNNKPHDAEVMLKGFENVLKARLSDAVFFFETDMKTPLGNFLDKLKTVLFQDKLGSMFDKVQRLLNLAQDVEEKQIIQLAKCDLVTAMVGEFPELQGRMGHLYAISQGMDAQ